MRKLLLLALLGALFVIALPSSATAGTKTCGKHVTNGTGWFGLKAEKASCKSAKGLADHIVFERDGELPSFADPYHDWVCAKVQAGGGVFEVQCTRKKGTKSQLVTFRYRL